MGTSLTQLCQVAKKSRTRRPQRLSERGRIGDFAAFRYAREAREQRLGDLALSKVKVVTAGHFACISRLLLFRRGFESVFARIYMFVQQLLLPIHSR